MKKARIGQANIRNACRTSLDVLVCKRINKVQIPVFLLYYDVDSMTNSIKNDLHRTHWFCALAEAHSVFGNPRFDKKKSADAGCRIRKNHTYRCYEDLSVSIGVRGVDQHSNTLKAGDGEIVHEEAAAASSKHTRLATAECGVSANLPRNTCLTSQAAQASMVFLWRTHGLDDWNTSRWWNAAREWLRTTGFEH